MGERGQDKVIYQISVTRGQNYAKLLTGACGFDQCAVLEDE